MSTINFELLKRVSETPGVPGYEKPIRDLIIKELEGLVDEIFVDNMGSLIATKKGADSKKVMVTAHMDEIGFIVSHIDDDGFIRFLPLGGFDPKTLTSQRVTIHGREDVIGIMGTKPIHIMSPEERTKAPQLKDYFIDTGLSKDELDNKIYIGATVTRKRSLIELGDCVNGKSLDNRVSVFILLETLRELKGKMLPYDLVATFTVQEEVGLRGAMSAAHQVNPDWGINLDVTIAFDTPGAQPHENVTKLGKGTAVKIVDGHTICDYRMVDYLKSVAERDLIEYQLELLPAGGTDTAAVQKSGKNGAIAGAISIPLRNMHSVIEMVNKNDIRGTVELLKGALETIDKYDWSH